jgi:hypothetical protein
MGSLRVASVALALCALLASYPTAAPPLFSDWSEPVNLGPVVNSSFNEGGPAVSQERRSLYFASDRPGRLGGNDIYVSQSKAESRATARTLPLAVRCTTIAVHVLEDPFVDDQITVRLPTPLGRTLRRTSRRLGRRPSDVVRMALEAFLQGEPSADPKRAERLEHLIGSLSSGVPDLAERHREYVLASLKHAR